MMQFGAIYTCPVPPPVPDELRDTFDTATLLRMENVRQQAMAATPPQFKYRGPKRLIRDEFVNKDSYVRVHFSPKRFPVYYDVDWTSRLVDIGPEHVVVDKPPLLPVAPTVDNVLESTLNGAASAIQLEESLHITSRLDHATEGLVVLGRTPNFVSKFNALLRESSSLGYKKWYKALTASPPPVGHLMHYVKVRCRQKGTPFFTLVLDDLEQKEQHTVAPDEKALFCELIVHSVTKLSSFLPSLSLQQYHNGEQREAYEVLIELITGRTHQIRAQLSAIGCPLYGDALYVPLACGQTRRVSL
jgi:16S rRNA U516 pseudouridylate synthase RsuA-like enzyme